MLTRHDTLTRRLAPLFLGAALLATGLLTGCSSPTLADTDPNGYAACTRFVEVLDIEDPTQQSVFMIDVGDLAFESSTEAIQESTTTTGNETGAFHVVDVEKLRAACTDAGVEVPS